MDLLLVLQLYSVLERLLPIELALSDQAVEKVVLLDRIGSSSSSPWTFFPLRAAMSVVSY